MIRFACENKLKDRREFDEEESHKERNEEKELAVLGQKQKRDGGKGGYHARPGGGDGDGDVPYRMRWWSVRCVVVW